MAVWFIPSALTQQDEARFVRDGELCIPADGLPDVRKALWTDQLVGWLRKTHPEWPGETLGAVSTHLWRLVHDVDERDHVVIADAVGKELMIGEVTSLYRHEERAEGSFHVLGVRWKARKVPLSALPAEMLSSVQTTEIADEVTLGKLKPSIPSLRRTGATIFKWLAATILVCEFIYWWPR